MALEKNKESGLSPEIARLSAQLARDPKSRLFIPLAEEYMKSGMPEEAVMALEEGLKVHPAYMSARVLLGKARLEKGDMEGALSDFETVVRAIPDNLLAHKKLADIYTSKGRYKEAIKSLRVVTILSPKDEEAKTLLSQLESGAAPTVAVEAKATKTVVESHMAGEAVKERPVYRPPVPPAAPTPPTPASPASVVPEKKEEAPPEKAGSKVYDLGEAGEAEDTAEESAEISEPQPETYTTAEGPAVVEMPVPEMETLQQARQAYPSEAGHAAEVEPKEEAHPTPEAELAVSPEEEIPFEVALEAEGAVEAEAEPEADFIMADEEEHPFEVAEEAQAAEEPVLMAEDTFVVPEAPEAPEADVPSLPVAPAPAPAPGPKAGYSVDIKGKGELEDIFETYGGAASEEEVPSESNRPVYEISDELAVSGPAVIPAGQPEAAEEVPPEAPAPKPAEREAPAREPFKTETLADIYISQGYYDRAISIYKDLLIESPGNKELKQKLEDLYLLAGVSSAKAAAKAKDEALSSPSPQYKPLDLEAVPEEVEAAEEVAEEIPFTVEPVEAMPFEAVPFEEATPGPAPFEAAVEEEIPFAVEPVEAMPFEAVPFEEAPAQVRVEVDEAAVGRLEQFLENARRKAKR